MISMRPLIMRIVSFVLREMSVKLGNQTKNSDETFHHNRVRIHECKQMV